MRMLSCERERREGSWDGESSLYPAASGAGLCWDCRGRGGGQLVLVVVVVVVVKIGIRGVEAIEGMERGEIGGGLRRDR